MTNKQLKWQLPFLTFLIIGTILILRKQTPYHTDQGLIFGTVYKITYQSEKNLKDDIENELRKVDNSLSPFNKKSTITAINNNTDIIRLQIYGLKHPSGEPYISSLPLPAVSVPPATTLYDVAP